MSVNNFTFGFLRIHSVMVATIMLIHLLSWWRKTFATRFQMTAPIIVNNFRQKRIVFAWNLAVEACDRDKL